MNSEKCVICDEEIPEGRQVCPGCEHEVLKNDYEVKSVRKPILKGDVFFADLNPVVGSETGGIRPVVVIQNNLGNLYSPTIVAAITSKTTKHNIPTHVNVKASVGGLIADSVIMLEQVRTIDKRRLKRYLGHLDNNIMEQVEQAAICSLGIDH